MQLQIWPYLFTVNKNNQYRLNPDELKDVFQEVQIFLMNKSYNDQMRKKTVLSYYQKAIKKKATREQAASELAYLQDSEDITLEIEQERREKLKRLNLDRQQAKIVEMLISGYNYDEIRKKLRINKKALYNQIFRIKSQNQTSSKTLA